MLNEGNVQGSPAVQSHDPLEEEEWNPSESVVHSCVSSLDHSIRSGTSDQNMSLLALQLFWHALKYTACFHSICVSHSPIAPKVNNNNKTHNKHSWNAGYDFPSPSDLLRHMSPLGSYRALGDIISSSIWQESFSFLLSDFLFFFCSVFSHNVF